MRLKSKLSGILAFLILIVIGVTAYLVGLQLQKQLIQDITLSNRSYALLTAEKFVDAAVTYLPEQSFVLFDPIVDDLVSQNPHLANVQIFNYEGSLLYDYQTEQQSQYLGELRVANQGQLQQIQSQNPSLMSADGVTAYWQIDTPDNFLNRQGSQLEQQLDFAKLRISDIFVPVNNQYAVGYTFSYAQVDAQITKLMRIVGLIALLALVISVGIGVGATDVITRNLQKLTDIVRKIATGDLSQRVKIKSKDEVGVLGKAINQMTDDLEKSLAARIFKEKTEKELELAAKIQSELLPTEIPKIPGLSVYAHLQSADKISGDIYDFIEHKTETEHIVFMYLADVTGHGISASLLSTTLNAAIALVAETQLDPVQILSQVNHTIKAKTAANVFVTLALLKYDVNTNKLTITNCGHEQPIIYRAASGEVDTLPPGGIAVGMVPEMEPLIKEEPISIDAGDTIILYSDGYPEAWQSETENLGQEAFTKIIKQNGTKGNAAQIAEAIRQEVDNYRKGFTQKDDMTILVAQRSALT